MDKLTEREKEIIYFGLSRLLDDLKDYTDEKMYQKEFDEIDCLRDKFKWIGE